MSCSSGEEGCTRMAQAPGGGGQAPGGGGQLQAQPQGAATSQDGMSMPLEPINLGNISGDDDDASHAPGGGALRRPYTGGWWRKGLCVCERRAGGILGRRANKIRRCRDGRRGAYDFEWRMMAMVFDQI